MELTKEECIELLSAMDKLRRREIVYIRSLHRILEPFLGSDPFRWEADYLAMFDEVQRKILQARGDD